MLRRWSGAKHRGASRSESGPKEVDMYLDACEVTLLSAGGESEQDRAGLGTSPACFAKIVEKGREERIFVGGRRSLLHLPCAHSLHTRVRFRAVICVGDFLSGSMFLFSTNALNTSLLVLRGTELQPREMGALKCRR